MDIQEVLEHSGLDPKERSIYTALLELGESTVLPLSKKAGVKRPTTYVVLGVLETKGFVSRVLKGKKVFFAAAHPKKILAEAEIKLKELRDAMPMFEAMLNTSSNRPRVTVYEGKTQLDKAYDEAFLIEGEVVALSNSVLVEEVFARTLQKVAYKTSPKFTTRELLEDSEAARAYAKRHARQYWEPRIMPKQFSPFETDIAVFGNTTLITSAKKEYFTVKIESPEIANAFRAMFEAMWQISTPPSKE